MNRVTLLGRLDGSPLPAETTGRCPVATVHLCVTREVAVGETADRPQRVPCVVPAGWLSDLRRWQEADFEIRLEGHLRKETLWYGSVYGACVLQVFADAAVPVVRTALRDLPDRPGRKP
jgi:hypothetical protein